jgi:hypothetical protein
VFNRKKKKKGRRIEVGNNKYQEGEETETELSRKKKFEAGQTLYPKGWI